jgi:CRISPR-associated protein Cas2
MLTRFIVTYDVRDDARLRRVLKVMRNFGEHLQYSVFDCQLSEKDVVLLRDALKRTIDVSADQVLIIKLGPADGNAAKAIESLGIQYVPPDRVVTVL